MQACLASGAATGGFQHNFHLHRAGLAPSNTFVGGVPTFQYITYMTPRRRVLAAASLIPVVLLQNGHRVSFQRAVGIHTMWEVTVQAVHSGSM